MMEFVQLCLTPVNVMFSLLLIGVFIYWGLFILGAVGLDLMDLDLDLDLDSDVDTDINATGGQSSSSAFVSFLRFFNVGDVPMMVLLSVLIFSLWAVSIISNFYFNPGFSVLISVALFIPNFIASLFVTKVMTIPFCRLFHQANLGISAPTQILGKTCVITTSEVTPKFGQAQITQDGPPITLNVRCSDGSSFSKGDEAVITGHDKDTDTYQVVPFDLEK